MKTNPSNPKPFDLEERTLHFAKAVRDFIRGIPQNTTNHEYSKQLIRSSASIGANYLEANEALSKKDFKMRVKISKKEAKETIYWLKLISTNNHSQQQRAELIDEATQLMKILGSILEKSK